MVPARRAKHKLMCPAGPEKASVPEDAPGVDGVSGTCKERSPAAGSAAGNRRHEPDGREHLKEQQPSLAHSAIDPSQSY